MDNGPDIELEAIFAGFPGNTVMGMLLLVTAAGDTQA